MSGRRYGSREGRLTKRQAALQRNAAFIHYGMPQRVEVPDERKPRTPSGKPLEASVNDEIYDAAKTSDHIKLWRNNRGIAIQGGHQVRYGVGPNGAADWIGYRRLFVTAEMVGKSFAQFLAIEAKRPGEKPDDNQQRFLNSINAAGGVAGHATSAAEAREIWERW